MTLATGQKYSWVSNFIHKQSGDNDIIRSLYHTYKAESTQVGCSLYYKYETRVKVTYVDKHTCLLIIMLQN